MPVPSLFLAILTRCLFIALHLYFLANDYQKIGKATHAGQ